MNGNELKEGAREAREAAAPWVRPLARLGYAANGVVYAAVGIFALQAALGPGGDANITREEAMARMLTAPLGQALLALIFLGLVGYSLGHFMMALRSPEKSDREGVSDMVNRGAHAVAGGILHLSLAAAALQTLLGTRGGEEGRSTEDWTALIMAQPLGRVAIGLAGLGLIGVGLYQLYKVVTAKFREALMRDKMSKAMQQFIVGFGRVGYTARAIVYGIMGGFLIQAARQYDAAEAGGLGQALASLSGQSYGPWVLGTVAAGFIAFGVYVILLARYRDFDL